MLTSKVTGNLDFVWYENYQVMWKCCQAWEIEESQFLDIFVVHCSIKTDCTLDPPCGIKDERANTCSGPMLDLCEGLPMEQIRAFCVSKHNVRSVLVEQAKSKRRCRHLYAQLTFISTLETFKLEALWIIHIFDTIKKIMPLLSLKTFWRYE